MKGIWRRHPSPAMIIACVALFAALSGTAVALKGHNSVLSDDIRNGQVKRQDLHTPAVTPPKTDVVKSRTIATAASTSAGTPTDLGGPSVTVKVPPGALVAAFAEVRMNITGGGGNEARVFLSSPGIFTNAQILSTTDSAPETKRTAPDSDDGVQAKVRGGWLVFNAPAGRHTFTLHYAGTGGGTATFQDRSLYVTVLG